MLRAIRFLEAKLAELYAAKLPSKYEEAQEHLYEIDDITEALQLLKEAEGIDEL